MEQAVFADVEELDVVVIFYCGVFLPVVLALGLRFLLFFSIFSWFATANVSRNARRSSYVKSTSHACWTMAGAVRLLSY